MSKELQSRLIKFTGLCISIKRHCNNSYEGDYLSKQLVRSASSSALNFGEARAAESKNDFIHKQSICLKELRESYVNLLIIEQNQICSNQELLDKAVDEANQLVSIFVTTIRKCTSRNK
jgi:four helix bundle protein